MSKDTKLVGPWRSIHGAVWLIGLAILFWKGWWWPGILVLVAISAIVEAVIKLAVPDAVEPAEGTEPPPLSSSAQSVDVGESQHRAELLPAECPKCSAPVRGNEVKWTGPQSADCPYCGANLPIQAD